MDESMYYPDQLEVAEAGAGFADMQGQVFGFNDILARVANGGNIIAELKKALSAGYDTTPSAMSGGEALRIQSLEPTLKNLTITDQSTALFNDLLTDKKMAESTVEEYSQIQDFAEAGTYEEGGIPSVGDDSYQRQFELVKFVGAVASVTNVILRVRTLVDAMKREEKSKMLAIKRKADQICYMGNKSQVSTEWNGLYPALVAAAVTNSSLLDNIIDMKGQRLRLEDVNSGVEILERQTGYTENVRMYLSPRARRDYKNELLADKRYLVGGDLKTEAEGLKSNKLIYDGGEAPMRKDVFLNPERYPKRDINDIAYVPVGDRPPNAPTITSATPTANTSAHIAGAYDYAVTAVNFRGHRSTPTETLNVVLVDAQSTVFVLADGGSPSGQTATAYRIYRKAAGSDLHNYRFLYQAGATDATIADDGTWIPDTSMTFLIEWDTEQVFAYKQLLEASKFPLGAVADSPRWLQRLYGVAILYNPKKIVVFKNCGSAPWA